MAALTVALCSALHGAPGNTTPHPVSRVQIGNLFRARSLGEARMDAGDYFEIIIHGISAKIFRLPVW
jgi:hypothetical protein